MQDPPRIIFAFRKKELMFSSQFRPFVGGESSVRPSSLGRDLKIRSNFATKSEQDRHCFCS
jgi:hypothetical protein